MHLLKYIVLCSCVSFACCSSEKYRAAVIVSNEPNEGKYLSLVHKAAESNVDIVMLPGIFIDSCADGQDNYDRVLDTLSSTIKSAGIYAAVELTERCRNKGDGSRSNLVFNRNGKLITEKMFKREAHKGTVSSFTTDFGVIFTTLAESDLILHHFEEFGDVKNILLFGSTGQEEYLFAKQFASSWAYVTSKNIISTSGIFGGRTLQADSIIVAELQNQDKDKSLYEVYPVKLSSYPGEDMSQYTTRPLDYEASDEGYTSEVCHGSFCCEFDIKTRNTGTKHVNYGLVAFEGFHKFGRMNIGAQSCLIVACAGLYKRSCFDESNNNTTTTFERISVKSYFTKNSTAQFPIIHTSSKTTFNDNFSFQTKNIDDTKHVSTSLKNVENILSFGIFGRRFDIDGYLENATDGLIDVTDYISSENVQEFFDYIWIRLRVVMFIVSIYVLEMM